jgi:hypothetical protein
VPCEDKERRKLDGRAGLVNDSSRIVFDGLGEDRSEYRRPYSVMRNFRNEYFFCSVGARRSGLRSRHEAKQECEKNKKVNRWSSTSPKKNPRRSRVVESGRGEKRGRRRDNDKKEFKKAVLSRGEEE